MTDGCQTAVVSTHLHDRKNKETMPVTALASIYGMNVIASDSTHVPQLVFILLVMASISGLLLRWTKKQGWW